ncbi:MinD/ParA family protein [Streptantibioticus silvisoli]|uniref:MinD/ParA family protein n=1 Tax=Streptantibioticus silvisoli TaxID=2705255 RepID=A0ABT6W787_9ACTN|nr:MinD/ParA family protein [Streptantibioticus silvisoli]MDI5965538.1 MinD/ParA family protein [Streptantibioticus silvisoli]
MSADDWQRAVLREISGGGPRGGDPSAVRPGTAAETMQYGAGPSLAKAPAVPVVAPDRSPQPVPPLAPEVAALATGRPVRGDAAAARALRALRSLFASSSAADVERAKRVAAVLQKPVTTGRQIVVTSVHGGAGKTTLAALLGTVYAHHRPDPVLVVEANPTLGTLPVRLGAPVLRWSADEFAKVVTPHMRFDQLIGYLVGLPDGGWLLPGSKGQIGAQLSLADYQRVAVAVRRFFAITVVDCQTLPGELARSAMAGAQARVLATPATPEGVAATRAVLDWMAGLPRPMLRGTVVALTQPGPRPALNAERAAELLGGGDVRVVPMPYDRHLARGGRISTGLLGRATHEAVTLLGADLLDLATRR